MAAQETEGHGERGEAPEAVPRARVLAILGPTATGKSAVAMAVAELTGAEIVNCDALQVYRGLDVGTAKPSESERSTVPHHLYDILEPTERFSAGRYAELAAEAVHRIAPRAPVLLVGGTGLYYRALTRGMAPIPPVPDELRRELDRRLRRDGAPALHRLLEVEDPGMAARLHPADGHRIVRALEVLRFTGRSQLDWMEEPVEAPLRLEVVGFTLTLERSVLYDRVGVRARRMFDGGWKEEVDRLLSRGVPRSAPAFQAIGYREIVDLLQGRTTEAEALEQILVSTRRYAKRQLTWFRREPGLRWRRAAASPALVKELADVLS